VIGAGTALRVAMPGFMACSGGDGYKVPEAAAACAERAGAPRTVDLVAGYVTDSLRGAIAPPPAGRITRH
jgi:hypothetical protein